MGDLSFISIQKSYPIHCHGYETEIFLYLAFKDIGAHLIQHVTELIIYLWKEHGFIEAGGIFKGDEFHRLPISGIYCLAVYQQTDSCYLFPHMGVEILGPDTVHVFQDLLISVKGMEYKWQIQSFQLVR